MSDDQEKSLFGSDAAEGEETFESAPLAEPLAASVVEMARGEPHYPLALEALDEPPARLWICGELPSGPTVAIVGSRQAGKPSIAFVRKLASEIALRGITVVSGGAIGIDTAAHQGALEAGGRTVVVLGAGLNNPYPTRNVGLYREVIREGGAVLTEFPPDTPPTRWTFPKRNRIVAALSLGVIVAEAGPQSGALITAHEARVLGRAVGAIPGLPGQWFSHGPHELIRRGAALVERVEDVLQLISAGKGGGQLHLPGMEVARPADGSDEARIFAVLGDRPVHIDDIAVAAGLGPAEASAALLQLELAGLAEEQGGKLFVRKS